MVLAHNIDHGQRTQDVRISNDVLFDSMLLSPNTLQGLKDSGFYKPSPIQLHAIPFGKCGFDLLLEAKSGTGKTAVFSIVALEQIDLEKGLQTVILAPTREIASQICDVIKQIGVCYEGLNVEVVMGGIPLHEDTKKFKKPVHIVVGSPGRLKHLIQDHYINTQAVRLLVLDEADKLMEKSFQTDIHYIFSALPKQKQVIMSSATYPECSKSFIEQYIQGAQTICPDSNCILLGIKQKVTFVKHNSHIVKQTQIKFMELLKILTNKEFKQCLIFCNYQARVSELHKMLNRAKWPAEQLYGQQDQMDRLDALKTLQEYKCRILIATDLAARGIDASNVDLVINFEPPFEWQTYLHRIGRAGRYGSYGTAITILSEGNEIHKFKKVISSIKASVSLNNLWTNEELNISDTKTRTNQTDNSQIELRTKIDCNQLWNIITTRDVKESEEIADFEQLCNSYQESKIESFSELFNSFQNDIYINDDDLKSAHQYITVNLSHIDLNDYSDVNSAIFKNSCKYKNEANIINKTQMSCENELYLENKIDNLTKKHDEKKDPRVNFSLSSDSDTNSSSSKSTSIPEIELNSSKNKKKIKSKKIEQTKKSELQRQQNEYDANSNEFLEQNKNICSIYQDTEAALLSAGLPTSFGSSKHMNSSVKRNKLRHGYNNKRSITNTYIKRDCTDNDYIDEDSYDSLDECRNLNRLLKISVREGDRKTYQSQATGRQKVSDTRSQVYRNTGANNQDRFDKYYKDRCTSNSEIGKSNSHHISTEYRHWYSQLKAQTKQIEYTIYIQELSKMT